jgi:hypothetical protein
MDIFEQTNNQQPNIMSLHSSSEPNCTIAGSGQSGTLLTNDCAVRSSPLTATSFFPLQRPNLTHEQFANSYIGCTVSSHQLSSATLNAARGGVFAMLWASQGMQMWTFGRNTIPPSIKNRASTPVLSEFGPPVANFQGPCDFDAHFFDHQMIFNTDFCGSNAGETFQMHGCPMVSCIFPAGCEVGRQWHAG